MNKILIMGSGAAPGVPSLSWGWGHCDPNNPRNFRTRVGNYIEYKGLKFLIDTSPDLRMQLINHNIRDVDFILYTHSHADHINGIDELRELNRILQRNLDIYGSKFTIQMIRKRFDYLIVEKNEKRDFSLLPSLIPHVVKANHPFYVNGIKIMPVKMLNHHQDCIGYVFDDGELVYVADFMEFAPSTFKAITTKPKVAVFPLTSLLPSKKHATLAKVLEYVEIINPMRVIINHMSAECDYEKMKTMVPSNVEIAFDGMEVEF